MTKHSLLPPSSAARRMACPGSSQLERAFPRGESDESIEGTLAHEAAAIAAKTGEVFGMATELFDNEIVEAANLYGQYIKKIIGDHKLLHFHVEEKLDISIVHPDCWGTPDCWLQLDNDSRDVHIVDFKYGHKYVDVFENWQLLEYACGVFSQITHTAIYTKIHLHIVQPRCYHSSPPISSWSIDLYQIQQYLTRLKQSEFLATRPDPSCTANPLCKTCSASHVCTTLQNAALGSVESSYLAFPSELSPPQLSNELRLLMHAREVIDSRITGLEVEALTLLKNGERLPHFKVEETKSRERWSVNSKQIKALGDLFDLDLLKEPEPITPKQAIKKGVPAEVIFPLTQTLSGSLKLAMLDANEGKKIFGRS